MSAPVKLTRYEWGALVAAVVCWEADQEGRIYIDRNDARRAHRQGMAMISALHKTDPREAPGRAAGS